MMPKKTAASFINSSLSTDSLMEAALGYAYRGWRVFPLNGIFNGRCTCGRRDCSSPGKHPLVRRCLHEASSELKQVSVWWRRWPLANIAIATGEGSGLVVIDVDLPLALRSLDAIVGKVPPTSVSLTGGGGLHLLLAHPPNRSIRNHASRLPGIGGELPGIDLRGEGGYIVAPPSRHVSGQSYSWLDSSCTIAATPDWLRERDRPEIPAGPPCPPKFTTGRGTAYGCAALENALTSMRSAPIGQRNHSLNRVAFSLAQLVAGGELLESAVRSSLESTARQIGLSRREIELTIASAFDAGLGQPRTAPQDGPIGS